MMNKYSFVSSQVILAKLSSDLRGTNLHESDIIDWVGEALGFMKVTTNLEEATAFLDVKNHHVSFPEGLQYIIQVAKDNNFPEDIQNTISPPSVETVLAPNVPVVLDHNDQFEDIVNVAYYRPYFDHSYEYLDWVYSDVYKQRFSPIRLANHTFFSSLVCAEDKGIYDTGCRGEEYTVAVNRLRFSFKEGLVAVSYLRTVICPETGYPMIPDNMHAITAISYYVKWKMAERFAWAGREGWETKADKAEARWNKYVKQANNVAKMPQGIDQWQDLMDQGNYLIPRRSRYFGFFGNLATPEQRPFNNPDGRLRNYN